MSTSTSSGEVAMSAGTGSAAPLLELSKVTKRYPGTVALDQLDLAVLPGKVHAVVGRNGAGKSTMIKIVSGIEQPDEGKVFLQGEAVDLRNPSAARSLGVVTVHQELSLIPQLTVAENVLLNRMPRSKARVLSWRAAQDIARDALVRLGFGHIAPDDRIADLAMSDRQAVEVSKAIVQKARVLLLDEPTASFSEEEAGRLLAMVRMACEEDGIGVIYVSHRLDEVVEISDRISVLRDGRVVDSWARGEVGVSEVHGAMLGASMVKRVRESVASDDAPSAAASDSAAAPALVMRGISDEHGLDDVSLTVGAGEIVAVVGLPGNGQVGLVETLFGMRKPRAGTVDVFGSSLRLGSVRRAIRAGVAVVPGERKSQGLVLDRSIQENLMLPSLSERRFARPGGVRRHAAMQKAARQLMQDLQIKATSEASPVGVLSGGTQQKVVLGKWLIHGSRLFVLDQPTRGIDVETKEEIYKLLRQATASGAGVLMITYELEEAAVADRVLVMKGGRIAQQLGDEQLNSALAGHEAVYGS
ncbi:MAG: Monosaccharide transporter ATP-binding protein family [Conexibacter sp.]|nr:Monosaccharide transporter ATP-binding protein family [Conexibacter sp.]